VRRAGAGGCEVRWRKTAGASRMADQAGGAGFKGFPATVRVSEGAGEEESDGREEGGGQLWQLRASHGLRWRRQ